MVIFYLITDAGNCPKRHVFD